MDQPSPKYKEPIYYAGTDTRDDYTNWQVSTEVSKKYNNDNLLKKLFFINCSEQALPFKIQN